MLIYEFNLMQARQKCIIAQDAYLVFELSISSMIEQVCNLPGCLQVVSLSLTIRSDLDTLVLLSPLGEWPIG